jgi:hypothetical protein
MISETFVDGKIIKKYKLPLDLIDDLNKRYESERDQLKSKGKRLAGRIKNELAIESFIADTKVYSTLIKCMNEFIMASNHLNLVDSPVLNLNIIGCWINDMKEGEYNPPHVHHDATGWSTVLFLKVPEIIKDVEHEHKFKDGQLAFTFDNGLKTNYFDPIVGDFYIFQASHQHSVMPFKTKIKGDIRRSMSFNFIENDK